MAAKFQPNPDILIAGAGIIGLSIALEMRSRGAQVTVLERDTPLSHASSAAAGMLAVHDPHNPRELLPLAELSASLYSAYLSRIESLSALPVPFQTDETIQYAVDKSAVRLAEHSIDPRQLAPALLAAVRAAGIPVLENVGKLDYEEAPAVRVQTQSGLDLGAQSLVHAQGAWFRSPGFQCLSLGAAMPRELTPRKGQMLRVALPPGLRDLREVHRSEHIYLVPRTTGPQAGSALIGATVEDAGFDTTTHAADLAHLRALASELLPALADASAAPQLEAWAGLRPYVPGELPMICHYPGTRHYLAVGHYRNGILLAPATAVVLADLLEGKLPAVDLAPFSGA